MISGAVLKQFSTNLKIRVGHWWSLEGIKAKKEYKNANIKILNLEEFSVLNNAEKIESKAGRKIKESDGNKSFDLSTIYFKYFYMNFWMKPIYILCRGY